MTGEAWLQSWKASNRGVGLTVHAVSHGGATIRARPRTTAHFSLGDIPADFELEIDAVELQMNLLDLAPCKRLMIRCSRPEGLHLQLDPSVEGVVSVSRRRVDENPGDDIDRRTSIEGPDCRAQLVVNGGTALIAHAPSLSMVLRDAQLTCGGSIKHLTLESNAVLAVRAASRIEKVDVVGDVALSIAPGGQRLSFGLLTGTGEGCSLSLAIDGNRPRVAVAEIQDIAVASTAAATIVADKVTRVRLKNAIWLELTRGGSAKELVGEAKDSVPTLVALPHAVCTGLSGEFDLGRVSGAHLEGSAEGFLIRGVAAETSGGNSLKHVVLKSFRIPAGLEGRTLLSRMEEAYFLDPSASVLPGTGAGYRFWRALVKRDFGSALLGSAPEGVDGNSVQQDAELLRELRRLVLEKGAPGSTRSQIGWSAYRMRHATTTGLSERLALSAYRSIGYGERPGPAIACWLFLTFGVTALVFRGRSLDLGWGGVFRFFAEFIHQAAGPLAAVMRSGVPPASAPYEYILRAIIAIPLVTAALALRNYVKDGGKP